MQFTKEETYKCKAVAILLLIFHHIFLNMSQYDLPNNNQSFYEKIQSLATDARVCVWVFVFLSAYGMAVAYEKAKCNFAFYKRRVFSLYSFFLPISILQIIVYYINNPNGEIISESKYILANIFGISDLFDFPQTIGVYWYISFTFIVIILFPLLYDAVQKYDISVLLIAVIMLCYLTEGIHSNYGGKYSQYLLSVLLGILFYKNGLFNKLKLPSQYIYKIIIFVFLLLSIFVLTNIRNNYIQNDLYQVKQILMTIAAAFIVVLIFLYIKIPIISRVMVYIGKHSGNMYLLHITVLECFKDYIYYTKYIFVWYITAVLLTLLCSIILKWFLKVVGYEKIINNVKKAE